MVDAEESQTSHEFNDVIEVFDDICERMYRAGELYTWTTASNAVFLVLTPSRQSVNGVIDSDVLVYTTDGQVIYTTWSPCANDVLLSCAMP